MWNVKWCGVWNNVLYIFLWTMSMKENKLILDINKKILYVGTKKRKPKAKPTFCSISLYRNVILFKSAGRFVILIRIQDKYNNFFVYIKWGKISQRIDQDSLSPTYIFSHQKIEKIASLQTKLLLKNQLSSKIWSSQCWWWQNKKGLINTVQSCDVWRWSLENIMIYNPVSFHQN